MSDQTDTAADAASDFPNTVGDSLGDYIDSIREYIGKNVIGYTDDQLGDVRALPYDAFAGVLDMLNKATLYARTAVVIGGIDAEAEEELHAAATAALLHLNDLSPDAGPIREAATRLWLALGLDVKGDDESIAAAFEPPPVQFRPEDIKVLGFDGMERRVQESVAAGLNEIGLQPARDAVTDVALSSCFVPAGCAAELDAAASDLYGWADDAAAILNEENSPTHNAAAANLRAGARRLRKAVGGLTVAVRLNQPGV